MVNSTQQKACLICDADEIDAESLLGSLPAGEMSDIVLWVLYFICCDKMSFQMTLRRNIGVREHTEQ